MTRYQFAILISQFLAVPVLFAQPTIPDTTHRCYYTQLNFTEKIYPLPFASLEVERIVEQICEAAGISEKIPLISAAIQSVAAVKDSTGVYYLVYSEDFANRLLEEHPGLLYGILAHEIGHIKEKHNLDKSFRLTEESLADKFMGETLFKLGGFNDINRLLRELDKRPFAYQYLYDRGLNKSVRENTIRSGWNYADERVKSKSNLGYYENEDNLASAALPLFKRSGCPRNHDFDKAFFYSCQTISDVDKLLIKALNRLGYEQRSYFYAENGFAMLTSVEQIDESGLALPGPERWQDYPALGQLDGILDYLSNIIFPRRGYFRWFVFYVSDQEVRRGDAHIQHEDAQKWLDDGKFRLPASIGNKAFTNSHHISVMIYEFEAPETTKRIKEQCSSNLLTINQHLNASGIFSALRKND